MINSTTTNVDNLTVNTASTLNGLTTITDGRISTLNSTTTNVDTLTVNTSVTLPAGSLATSSLAWQWATTSEEYFWNNTSTWAGFLSEFNDKLNNTTTLDLAQIQIGSDVPITDITGSGLSIVSNALTVDTDSLGINGAWEENTTNVLTPTNTSAGIFVQASSTIAASATTTGSLSLIHI